SWHPKPCGERLRMRVPEEFNRMCALFHQDIGRMNIDDAIKFALGGLDKRQSMVVKRFLDKLLSGRYTAAEMKGVLRRSPADFGFGNERCGPAFHGRMRDWRF